MKIAIALHSCMDLGGIINHTNNLIEGFRECDHQCDLFEMVYRDTAPGQNKSANERIGDGVPFSQWSGWCFPKDRRLAYKSYNGLQKAKATLNEYDMVIWTVPVPPKNKDNLGNYHWPELYDLNSSVKQVAISHDGNAKDGYPHILKIKDRLSAVVAVHDCSFNASDYIEGVPRYLIMNPQLDPIGRLDESDSYGRKFPGFVNMQNFKAWKHVDELIRAIIEMPERQPDELREVAGMGIQYRYMTSKDKCKPEFFLGEDKIWDLALANGMTHHDYWTTDRVNEMLKIARVLVDPSWSTKYSKNGGHWNRVAVEAMMNGCVVVAQPLGMSGVQQHGGDLFGDPAERSFFESDVHYVSLGQTKDPKEYADIIMRASAMEPSRVAEMVKNYREKLKYFDRQVVAEQFIAAAHNGDFRVDFYKTGKTEEIDYNQVNKCNKLLAEHYGIQSI